MVQVLTVKGKIPLFKGDQPANSIELLQFNEVDFEVVRGKDMNQIGDELLFVHPDYCLPETELFKEYIAPDGDPKKSKLGRNHRVRAVKFNLHRGDGNPVYSNGIVLTYEDVHSYFVKETYPINLFKAFDELTSEDLGITKYVEPEESTGGGTNRNGNPMPQGIYKTDETNILRKNDLKFPMRYMGTVKVDGSSITLFYAKGVSGICSGNTLKPLTRQVVIGRRKKKWYEYITSYFKKVNLNIYDTVENDDIFIKVGKPYLDDFVKFCEQTGAFLCLRGELCGLASKGSGNSKNPHAKLQPQVLWYGIDSYYNNLAIPYTMNTFMETLVDLNVNSEIPFVNTNIVFDKIFESKEELIQECYEYFKSNMIEGIVVRNPECQSAKVMNLEYDSKK